MKMGVILAAYLLDLWIGDPQVWFHPIRILGKMIEWGENFFRSLCKSEFCGGTFLAMGVPALVYFFITIFIQKLNLFYPYLASLAEVILIYLSLSVKDLAVESRWVREGLRKKDLELARNKLSWIVGRDTENLEEKEVVRATVETIAESTVDGIMAPLFYAFIGGAPLAFTYKAVNTLDSMIGHKNTRYLYFGKSAAAIDRWANFIPARLAGWFIPIASLITGHSFKKSWSVAWSRGALTKIPNAGIPEGALAGALSVQLGGTNFYEGKEVNAELLGEPLEPLSLEKIDSSISIAYVASALFLLFGLGILFVIQR